MTRQDFEAWATAHGWMKDQWGHYHKGDRRFKLSKVGVAATLNPTPPQ